jgi:hypothetical protein
MEISLARWTSDLPSDLPSLLGRYFSADREAAAKAAYVLVTWWGDRDEVLPVLRAEVTGGRDHATRIRSLMALVTRLGPCAETRDLLENASASDCPGVRQAALEMLTQPVFGDLTRLAKKATTDDDVIVRLVGHEWLALQDVSSHLLGDLLVGPVPSADPDLEQYLVLRELVLRGREAPQFSDLVRRISRNIGLTDTVRDWLDWFCVRIAA